MHLLIGDMIERGVGKIMAWLNVAWVQKTVVDIKNFHSEIFNIHQWLSFEIMSLPTK